MTLISVTNLTFAYEGSYDNIFEDVSFQIDTSWKLGFTGRNGRGKTTFLNLLLGKYPYSGKISSSLGFDYFPFEVADKNLLTQEIVDQINFDYEPWQLSRELSLLGVDDEVLYRPFATLSNGEQTKVMLAALFLKPNNFLLIDEPTNHLDAEARLVVSDYLKAKKGFILVSHDRRFLDNSIDHVLAINKKDIQIQKGNFSSWWHNKTLQDNFELAENQKLKSDIKRLEAAAKRTAKWSEQVENSKSIRVSGIKPDKGYIGHKAAKMMKHTVGFEAKQQKAAAEKSKLLKNIEKAEALKIPQLSYHTSRLIGAKDLGLFYDDKPVCQGISFEVEQGDRVALCGKNGSGKSSLLKLILGQDINYTGLLEVGSRLKISYVPQDTSFLAGSLDDFAAASQIDESLFKTILRKLDFSGGQKKKVLLAKSLCQQANLYIWDEPLNFIDVISRMQIEELLQKYQPTMIFVEHDAAFKEAVATKTISL